MAARRNIDAVALYAITEAEQGDYANVIRDVV